LTHGPVRRIPLHVHISRGSLTRLERPAAAESAAEVEPHRPAIITVSKRETGAIRATACSHAALWARSRYAQGPLAAERVDMPVLPALVLDNLACGTTSVLPDLDPSSPRVVAAATIVHQMEVELVATSSGPPDFYDRLCRWCAANGRKLPLRALRTGGQPVPPPLARRLADTTRGDVIVVYGTREAMPIARIETRAMFVAMARDRHGQPPDGLCVGTPVAGLTLLLIRVTDEPIRLGPEGWTPWPVEPGAVGEVVVAGDHVLTGSANGAEADPASSVHDGERVWHRTGDAGRLDEEGRLWLMGQIHRRVRREDRTWWSIPAEMRTFKVAGIAHAAYFGVLDPRLGQRAVLCVEVHGRKLATVERDRLRAALAPMPVDELHVMRRIPRDARHASTTDMRSLLEWVAERGPALSA
jgi:acyl-CoA synthetase (AMP-forming)/AMP-acid ligase II